LRLGFESFAVCLDWADRFVENRNYFDHFVVNELNSDFENRFLRNFEGFVEKLDRLVEKLEADYRKTKLDRFV